MNPPDRSGIPPRTQPPVGPPGSRATRPSAPPLPGLGVVSNSYPGLIGQYPRGSMGAGFQMGVPPMPGMQHSHHSASGIMGPRTGFGGVSSQFPHTAPFEYPPFSRYYPSSQQQEMSDYQAPHPESHRFHHQQYAGQPGYFSTSSMNMGLQSIGASVYSHMEYKSGPVDVRTLHSRSRGMEPTGPTGAPVSSSSSATHTAGTPGDSEESYYEGPAPIRRRVANVDVHSSGMVFKMEATDRVPAPNPPPPMRTAAASFLPSATPRDVRRIGTAPAVAAASNLAYSPSLMGHFGGLEATASTSSMSSMSTPSEGVGSQFRREPGGQQQQQMTGTKRDAYGMGPMPFAQSRTGGANAGSSFDDQRHEARGSSSAAALPSRGRALVEKMFILGFMDSDTPADLVRGIDYSADSIFENVQRCHDGLGLDILRESVAKDPAFQTVFDLKYSQITPDKKDIFWTYCCAFLVVYYERRMQKSFEVQRIHDERRLYQFLHRYPEFLPCSTVQVHRLLTFSMCMALAVEAFGAGNNMGCLVELVTRMTESREVALNCNTSGGGLKNYGKLTKVSTEKCRKLIYQRESGVEPRRRCNVIKSRPRRSSLAGGAEGASVSGGGDSVVSSGTDASPITPRASSLRIKEEEEEEADVDRGNHNLLGGTGDLDLRVQDAEELSLSSVDDANDG